MDKLACAIPLFGQFFISAPFFCPDLLVKKCQLFFQAPKQTTCFIDDFQYTSMLMMMSIVFGQLVFQFYWTKILGFGNNVSIVLDKMCS